MNKIPYIIEIHVVNGDADGLKVLEKSNRTSRCFSFPKSKLDEFLGYASSHKYLNKAACYILVGDIYNDMPEIYIGESDNISMRLKQHTKDLKKQFWEDTLVFLSSDDKLNKTHVLYLQNLFYEKAIEQKRCNLVNNSKARKPNISPADTIKISDFYSDIIDMLPLLNLHVFEEAKKIIPGINSEVISDDEDMIVVPANRDGFESAFLKNNCWYAIRISKNKLNSTKFIAAYITGSIRKITHYAEIKDIEPYGNGSKYKVNFLKSPQELSQPISLDNLGMKGTLRSPRYIASYKILKFS